MSGVPRRPLAVLLAGLLLAGPLAFQRVDRAAATSVCDAFATGGTVTLLVLDGFEYCRHVFSAVGSSTFVVRDPRLGSVDYLIVGGGGSGGARDVGGGGGAGGLLTGTVSVRASTPYAVVVGAGGAASSDGGSGNAGGNSGGPSSAFDLTAVGGGGGGGWNTEPKAGGSGGGGNGIGLLVGADGTAGQGFAGGNGSLSSVTTYGGGGGGGASAPGLSASDGRHGGAGRDLSATFGTDVGVAGVFAGGGGGAGHRASGDGTRGVGGAGGGGAAEDRAGVAGVAGSGGGGGASRAEGGSGGAGGSGVVIVRYAIPPASPTSAVCDGTVTQNGLTVTAGHGEALYINTGQGERIDAGYVAYRVSSDSARSDLWVEVAGFSGGVVAPADPTQTASPLGAVDAAGSRTAYFMVKAAGATRTAQSHRVNVYDRKPVAGVTRPLASCAFTFVEVIETLRAASNRIESISLVSSERIGSEVVITVDGDTGVIGQGNRIDGRMIWLSPAARSDWPVSSLRLESVEVRFFSDADRSTELSVHTDVLRVNATTSPALSNTRRQFYTATYRFRVIGPAAATAPVVAVAMISSGAQVKHTDLATDLSGTTLDLTSTDIDVALLKDVRTTTVVDEDGTTVTYDLRLVNSGADDVVVDEIVDTPDAELTLVLASVSFEGQAVPDPVVAADSTQLFSGPFVVPAGETRVLTYEMRTETCAPGGEFSFTNTATARIGAVVVGSSTATRSVVNLAGACGVEEAFATVIDEQLDPEVVTGAAADVTRTSATLTGTVDANGDVGSTVRFRIAERSDLAGPTERTVDVGPTTGGVDPEGVSAAVTGLRSATTYHYRIEVDVTGDGPVVGATRTFTTPPDPAPPVAVTGEADAVTTSSAVLEGTVDANLVEGGAKVVFEWEQRAVCAADGSPLDAAGATSGPLQSEIDADEPPATEDLVLTGASPAALRHTVDGLDPDEDHCFRIVALHGVGFATRTVGDWVTFTTTARLAQTIVWSPRSDPLPAGGSTQLVAVSRPSDDLTDLTGLSVTYTSVDPDVCTVAPDGTVTAVADSGTCAITATQPGDATYAPATPATISFEISPPTVTTTTLSAGRYGAALTRTLVAAGGDGSYSGWSVVAGQGSLPDGVTLDAVTGVLSGTPTEAGTFRFAVTTTSNGVVSLARSLTLVVERAVLSVTASSPTVTFGGPAPTVTPSYTGFLLGDTAADLDVAPNVAPTCTSTYAVGDGAGTTPTTACTGGWSTNYTLVPVAGSVTIVPLALTLTAQDAAKQNLVDTDGTVTDVRPDPTFTFTLTPSLPTGLTIDDVIDGGAAGVSFTRPAGETPGTYTVTPAATLTADAADDFTLAVATGTLIIQTPLIVPALTPPAPTITYGTDLSGGALAVSASDGTADVPGTFTFATAAGTAVDGSTRLPAGTHTIVAMFVPDDGDAFYGAGTGQLLSTTILVTVAPAPLVVTAVDTEKAEGTPDPTLTRTVSGLVEPSDAAALGAITIGRAPGEAPGSYTITTSGASHPDYEVTHVPGSLHVTRLRVVTTPTSGVVTSQEVALDCGGLASGSTVRLLAVADGAVLTTTSVSADGTCPLSVTLPDRIPDGAVTLRMEGVSPLGTALTVERTFVLSTGRAAPVQTGVTVPPASSPPPAAPPAASPDADVAAGEQPATGAVPGSVVPPDPAGDGDAGADPDADPPTADPADAPVGDDDAGAVAPDPSDLFAGAQFLPGSRGGTDVRDTSDIDRRDRRPRRLEGEEFRGFDTASSIGVEALGTRTLARFVLSDVGRFDAFAVAGLIRTSASSQATDFAALPSVTSVSAGPPGPPIVAPSAPVTEVMEAVGLGRPRQLGSEAAASASGWLALEVTGSGYVPGSVAHLIVTSQPLVLASGIVAQDGTFRVLGHLPLGVLERGEHRIRLVGIRELGPVVEIRADSVYLTAQGLEEARRFDVPSRAVVALVGSNPEGGSHVAVRIVNLAVDAPWWTLAVIVAVTILAARERRRVDAVPAGGAVRAWRRRWQVPAVVASAVPAVVLGWSATATAVILSGLALALLAATVVAALPSARTE